MDILLILSTISNYFLILVEIVKRFGLEGDNQPHSFIGSEYELFAYLFPYEYY
jgi:hypothetical protein